MSENNYKDEKKKFVATMKKGTWRERYNVVKRKHIEKIGIGNDPVCRELLRKCAMTDPAYFVRTEAVNTCFALGIKHKDKTIVMRKMPSLCKIIPDNAKQLAKKFELAFMKAEIDTSIPNRELSEKELKKVSNKFEELYPKLFDLYDGRTTNLKENINKKKNISFYKKIQKQYNLISGRK